MQILFESIGLDLLAPSERGVAARIAAHACEYADVSVVVPRAHAERTRASLPKARVLAIDYDPPRLPLNHSLHYTYRLFASRARSAVAEAGIRPDLVHRLNPLAVRHPSAFAGLGIPLVLGPLGGSLLPRAFLSAPGDVARNLLKTTDRIRLELPGALRRTYDEAQAILCSTEALAERLPRRYLSRCIHLCEGVDTDVFVAPPLSPDSTRLLFVGRLIPYKGLDHLLIALSRCLDLEWTLRVAGDGPIRSQLEELAESVGVAARIRWLGRMDRPAVLEEYAACRAVCSPGYNESTGNVVMEALSCGRPLVVADWAGPRELCPDGAGVKAPVTSVEAFRQGLADGVRLLLTDAESCLVMGELGRQHAVERLSWGVVLEEIRRIHERVAAGADGISAAAAS